MKFNFYHVSERSIKMNIEFGHKVYGKLPRFPFVVKHLKSFYLVSKVIDKDYLSLVRLNMPGAGICYDENIERTEEWLLHEIQMSYARVFESFITIDETR
jgi:hypothetical protein